MVTPPETPQSSVVSDSNQQISSSPYYLSTSDHPHHVLTPFFLNAENYEKWAKIARNNLLAKHKVGFVDGTLSQPPETSPDYSRWITTNSMLVGWLYASLDSKVQKAISFGDNTKVLWDNLKTHYYIGNQSRIHEIKTAISKCSQERQEVTDYFGKLKGMWYDLDDFEPLIDCCCTNENCSQRVKQLQRGDHEQNTSISHGSRSVKIWNDTY